MHPSRGRVPYREDTLADVSADAGWTLARSIALDLVCLASHTAQGMCGLVLVLAGQSLGAKPG